MGGVENIVIIEKNLVISHTLEKWVGEIGHEVLDTFCSIEEAVRSCDKESKYPSLVIVDTTSYQDYSYSNLCHLFFALLGIPILVTSCDFSHGSVYQRFYSLPLEILSKPYTRVQLSRALKKARGKNVNYCFAY